MLLVIISSFIDLFCLQDKRHAELDNAMVMTELNFHDNNAYVDLPEGKTETAEYNLAENSDKTVNPVKPVLEKNERVNGKVLKDITASLNMSVDSDLTENNLDNIDPELESKWKLKLHKHTYNKSVNVPLKEKTLDIMKSIPF